MSDETPAESPLEVEIKPDSARRVAVVGEIPFAEAVAELSHDGCEVEIVSGDLSSAQALSATLQDSFAVCFLSPINMSGRVYRPASHLADVQAVIQAAEAHALRNLVYHSALG